MENAHHPARMDSSHSSTHLLTPLLAALVAPHARHATPQTFALLALQTCSLLKADALLLALQQLSTPLTEF
jgi:hypothetical protein